MAGSSAWRKEHRPDQAIGRGCHDEALGIPNTDSPQSPPEKAARLADSADIRSRIDEGLQAVSVPLLNCNHQRRDKVVLLGPNHQPRICSQSGQAQLGSDGLGQNLTESDRVGQH